MNQPIKKLSLYEMRKQSGLTTTEIAHRIGKSYPTLLNWENGKSIPDAVSLRELLKIYKHTYDELNWDIFEQNVK